MLKCFKPNDEKVFITIQNVPKRYDYVINTLTRNLTIKWKDEAGEIHVFSSRIAEPISLEGIKIKRKRNRLEVS